MLMDVMIFFSLTRDFDNAGFFETDHHQQIVREVKGAVKHGKTCGVDRDRRQRQNHPPAPDQE